MTTQAVTTTCRPTLATAAASTAQGYGMPAIVTSNHAPWWFS